MIVGLGCFAWLDWINPPFLVTDDGIRDLLIARDCAELGRCHSIGSPTSLEGFHQGAVWVDALAAVRLLGGDVETQRHFVLALAAVAAATVCVVVWQWLHPALALPAALLFVIGLGKDYLPVQLVSGGASALPNALAAGAILAHALSGRRRFLVAASLALALAINEHVVSLLALPAIGLVAILTRPTPWRSVALATTTLVLVCLATSSAALRANTIAIFDSGWAPTILISASAAALLAARSGGQFRALAPTSRAAVVAAAFLLPFAAGSLWLLLSRQHHFSTHYWNPVLAPAAVLAAAVGGLPFVQAARRAGAWTWVWAWVPTLAVVAVIAVVARGEARLPRFAAPSVGATWSIDDARAIAGVAADLGWGFDDMRFRLQGGSCRELLAQIALFSPAPLAPRGPTLPQLRVTRAADSATPTDGGAIVRLESGVAILAGVAAWSRPDRVRSCRQPTAPPGPRLCQNAPLVEPHRPPGDEFLFAAWSFPEIHSLETEEPYVASYTFPLRPSPGERRTLAVLDDGRARCPWRITRAVGVEIETPLPAPRVTLTSPLGKDAELTVEKVYDTGRCGHIIDMRYPPCLIDGPLVHDPGAEPVPL